MAGSRPGREHLASDLPSITAASTFRLALPQGFIWRMCADSCMAKRPNSPAVRGSGDGRSREGRSCGWENGGRSNNDECEWDMMSENDRQLLWGTSYLLHIESAQSWGCKLGLEPAAWFWATREKILRVQSVRGTVHCLHSPLLTMESLVACERYLPNKNEKCTHLSCHPVDDHRELEDDDQELEDWHQLIQPELWSTEHATGFSVLDVCWSVVLLVAWPVEVHQVAGTVALGAVGFDGRVEWWERIGVQLHLLPFSFHECLPMLVASRLVIELELQCVLDCSSSSSMLPRTVLFPTTWPRMSASPATSSKCLQNSSVRPMLVWELWQDAWVWNRWSIGLKSFFIAFLGVSLACWYVLSLIFWSTMSSTPLCSLFKMWTRGLSPHHTSPCSVFVLLLKEQDNHRNHNTQFLPSSITYTEDIGFWQRFVTIRSLRHVPLCESFVLIPR